MALKPNEETLTRPCCSEGAREGERSSARSHLSLRRSGRPPNGLGFSGGAPPTSRPCTRGADASSTRQRCCAVRCKPLLGGGVAPFRRTRSWASERTFFGLPNARFHFTMDERCENANRGADG